VEFKRLEMLGFAFHEFVYGKEGMRGLR